MDVVFAYADVKELHDCGGTLGVFVVVRKERGLVVQLLSFI